MFYVLLLLIKLHFILKLNHKYLKILSLNKSGKIEMNRISFIIYFCLIAEGLNCQVLPSETSDTIQIKPGNIINRKQDTVTKFNIMPNDLVKGTKLLAPEAIFLLRRHFQFIDTASFNDDKLSLSALSLTSPVEYSFSGNKKELLDYLNNIYLQSKPTEFQNIMGDLNFSGALFLAGYRIWKDYIRK